MKLRYMAATAALLAASATGVQAQDICYWCDFDNPGCYQNAVWGFNSCEGRPGYCRLFGGQCSSATGPATKRSEVVADGSMFVLPSERAAAVARTGAGEIRFASLGAPPTLASRTGDRTIARRCDGVITGRALGVEAAADVRRRTALLRI